MAIGSAINGIMDSLKVARDILWNIIKTPFIWWFNLPSWIHWISLCLFLLIAWMILVYLWRNRNLWRERYSY